MDIEGIPVTEFYPYMRAAEKIPGQLPGKPISKRTVERWRSRGIRRGGVWVKLRTIRLSGDWYTCDAWVQAFRAELNRVDAQASGNEAPPRTPSQREKASCDARRRLDAMWARTRK